MSGIKRSLVILLSNPHLHKNLASNYHSCIGIVYITISIISSRRILTLPLSYCLHPDPLFLHLRHGWCMVWRTPGWLNKKPCMNASSEGAKASPLKDESLHPMTHGRLCR